MKSQGRAHSLYSAAGVDTAAATTALGDLLSSVRSTFPLRTGVGRPLLPIGYFANVLDLGSGQGLAISTDGVGTKALVAQMLEKYDTIGVDCIAMNVNDVICVGAEPIAMVDYLGVQVPDRLLFRDLGKGLLEGARQSGISIPGGEVAQIAEMIHGVEGGRGFDLVGTCVGLVGTDQILTGQNLEDGDVVVGLASSGIHSNGLSLARRVLLDSGRFKVTDYIAEFGRTLGEELLEPTIIYVRFAVDALASGIPLKALIHITGDGFLNLTRVAAAVGFEIEDLFEVPAIFDLIQRTGDVPDEEMFRVFNMGTGLCAVVAEDTVAALEAIAHKHRHQARVLGRVRAGPERNVTIAPRGLVGQGQMFSRR